MGTVTYITPKITTDNKGIVTQKVVADLTSMVKAAIIAPNTMNGERKNNLKTMFTPVCNWLISDVIRVINVDVPIVSASVKENFCMCSIRAKRNLTANPTEALAEKYWAISEQVKPTSPNTAIKPHIL
jgi:hypothetical protein